jgi:hypothetical protein
MGPHDSNKIITASKKSEQVLELPMPVLHLLLIDTTFNTLPSSLHQTSQDYAMDRYEISSNPKAN